MALTLKLGSRRVEKTMGILLHVIYPSFIQIHILARGPGHRSANINRWII